MASFFDWLIGNKKTDTTSQTEAQKLEAKEATKLEQQSKAVKESSASQVAQNQQKSTTQTQDQTSKTTGTQNQQQKSDTTAQQQTQTASTSQQQSQVTNLDAATQAALQSVLGTLTTDAGVLSGESLNAILGNSPVLQSLQQKALSGGEDIDAIVEAAKKAAELSYSENEAPQIQKKINATGSEDNTLAMILRDKGASDLATKVGNLEGQLRLQGSAQDTATKQAAVNAGIASGTTRTGAVGDISGISNILKGATQTAQTTQQQQTSQNATSSQSTASTSATQSATEQATKLQSQIDEALKSITDTKTATEQITNFLSSIFSSEIDLSKIESNTTGSSSTNGTIWDILNALRPRATG